MGHVCHDIYSLIGVYHHHAVTGLPGARVLHTNTAHQFLVAGEPTERDSCFAR